MSSFLSYTLFLFLVLLNLPIAFYHQIKNNVDSFSHPAELDSVDPVCLRCRIFFMDFILQNDKKRIQCFVDRL